MSSSSGSRAPGAAAAEAAASLLARESARVAKVGGGRGRRGVERVDHVVAGSRGFVVPVRERVVVDAVGELVECRSEMLERQFTPVVGLFFQGRDERAQERPGDRRFLPGLHFVAVSRASVCVLAPTAANELAGALEQVDGTAIHPGECSATCRFESSDDGGARTPFGPIAPAGTQSAGARMKQGEVVMPNKSSKIGRA